MAEVFVAYGDSASDTAALVLASAEKAGLPADSVRSVEGGFYVDEKVAKDAKVDYQSEEAVQAEAVAKVAPAETQTGQKAAAKKAPARKTTAKKATTAKRTTRRK